MDIENLNKIISDIKSSSNKDLMESMDFLSDDFEQTKQMIINLSLHLDNVENLYNKVWNEYTTRNGR
jgi:hypothetical protein